jgi:hypothetical protein
VREKQIALNTKRIFKNFNFLILEFHQVDKMIFSSLFSAFLQTISKPWRLLPAVIVSLFSAIIINFIGWTVGRPFLDMFVYYDSVPAENVLGYILYNYPLEIIVLIIAGFAVTLVSIIGMVSIARMANRQGMIDAVNDSVMEWKKSLGATIVFYCAFLLFMFALFISLWLSEINDLLGSLAMILVFIVSFICAVKIIFAVPVLQEEKTKKAFQVSWKFTNKHFWGAILLFCLALVISSFGWLLLEQLGIMLGEVLEILLIIIGEAFAFTYLISSITNYFYSKQ